jgi:hypothetical protein
MVEVEPMKTRITVLLIALIMAAGCHEGVPHETTTTAPATTTTVPSSGFPDASNTGPTGTLTPQSGSITTTAHGQVIENIDLVGSIEVAHNNVVIRNVRIRSAGQAIHVNGETGLVVEDCELDGTGATDGASAISEHNYTIRRCEIHHFGEGPRSNGNVVIEDNYMHSFLNFIAQGAHQDGIQITSGNNHQIVGNNINICQPDGSNAAIFAGTFGGDSVVVEDNLLSGGSYTVAIEDDYTNGRVVNNEFAICHNPNNAGIPSSAWYGAIHAPTSVVSGNTWHDGPNAGQPVT